MTRVSVPDNQANFRRSFFSRRAGKVIIFSIILVALPLATVLLSGDPIRWQIFKAQLEKIGYGVEVEVSGMKRLDEAEVRRLLPLDYSKIWWRFNCADVKSMVMDHPLISKAIVTPRSWHSFGSYRVVVSERKPQAMLKTEDGRWLLLSDGGYVIGTIESRRVLAGLIEKFSSGSPLPIPVVLGVELPGISVGKHHSRLAYAVAAIKNLRSIGKEARFVREGAVGVDEVGLKPRVVKMLPSGELEVVFEGRSFPVRFSDSSGNPEVLSKELRRLSVVLKALQDPADIASIDLAFRKVAVVRRKSNDGSEKGSDVVSTVSG